MEKSLKKHFCTGGPCRPSRHYMVPTEPRIPLVRELIDAEDYFIIHAPRQVWKTTTFLNLARELTASGDYTACLVSCEVGATFRNDLKGAQPVILSAWQSAAATQLPEELRPPDWKALGIQWIHPAIESWAVASPRPLVLFIDEIDALVDDTLVGVLRQQSMSWSLQRGMGLGLGIG